MNTDSDATPHQTSLISSFVVKISQGQEEENTDKLIWSLFEIDNVVSDEELSSSAKSWRALHLEGQQRLVAPTAFVLECYAEKNVITVRVASQSSPDQDEMISTLAKIMAQSVASGVGLDAGWNFKLISSSGVEEEIVTDISCTVEGIQQFFESDAEIVDMVDQEGAVLGMVPRSLVHSFNILHRGIGVIVSKDAEFSELYVHRRTDSKRIFPGMYDMFCGGVSGSGEDARLTAAREVAEELGLSRALDDETSHALSDPLFKCVVCTSYNRCVVTVFRYIMDPASETVSWQEEEVSWGEFVPYDIVEASADLSIQRLLAKKEWPGTLPVIQSKWRGRQPTNQRFESGGAEQWDKWDYVPDGLLVWEAWLRWRSK